MAKHPRLTKRHGSDKYYFRAKIPTDLQDRKRTRFMSIPWCGNEEEEKALAAEFGISRQTLYRIINEWPRTASTFCF